MFPEIGKIVLWIQFTSQQDTQFDELFPKHFCWHFTAESERTQSKRVTINEAGLLVSALR